MRAKLTCSGLQTKSDKRRKSSTSMVHCQSLPGQVPKGRGLNSISPSGYAQFSGAGTSDEVAALLPQLASTLYIGFAKRMRLSSGNNDSQSIATINR